ncbi:MULTISPECIES: PD-(D/E)XK nuclease family protein [Sphingobacterium]|uniref:PDDEXK-like family protein n=1 Tax=Sphingobacterium TaxID=28453 RepID=UPI00257B9243|nr:MULTISPECIES: PD-(D/E)XK nuclease family protein [Sphingobacterium]
MHTITEKLLELEKDEHFQKLKALLQRPNIFQILKLDRYEIRHSNFIAWLLNPNEKHGLGTLFLDKVLGDLIPKEVLSKRGAFKWIKRESINNIDLFIQFDDLIVAIENKFDSGEHSDQLTNYREYVDQHFLHISNRFFVFLTPGGKLTISNNEYKIYSYATIAKHLNHILTDKTININVHSRIYIEDYLKAIQATLMKTNPENLLAAQLYNQYKDVFDFVKENINSDVNYITHRFNLLLEQNVPNYVRGSEYYSFSRFTTSPITEIMKPIKNTTSRAWKGKEPFLFEISMEKEERRIVFLVGVSDFNKELNQFIHQIFTKNGLICLDPMTPWKVYNITSIYFDFNSYKDDDYIKQRFDEIYQIAKRTVLLVERLILNNREDIDQLYKIQNI